MSQSDADSQDPINHGDHHDLGPTLNQLAPIRLHRLTMAEQAWQRQRGVLKALQVRLTQMTQDLQLMREQQRLARQEQQNRHTNLRLTLHQINQWLAHEQRALQQIERVEHSFTAMQAEHRQQQQSTDESQLQLQKRQRDMEKLEYMRELSQAAS